jgi:hypothetical protein
MDAAGDLGILKNVIAASLCPYTTSAQYFDLHNPLDQI